MRTKQTFDADTPIEFLAHLSGADKARCGDDPADIHHNPSTGLDEHSVGKHLVDDHTSAGFSVLTPLVAGCRAVTLSVTSQITRALNPMIVPSVDSAFSLDGKAVIWIIGMGARDVRRVRCMTTQCE